MNILRPRYFFLDVLRASAAISVVFTHWVIWDILPYSKGGGQTHVEETMIFLLKSFVFLFGGGTVFHPGVMAFVILSGFLIQLPFSRDSGSSARIPWQTWLRRRLFTIVPLYWLGGILGLTTIAVVGRMPVHLIPPQVIFDCNMGLNWTDILNVLLLAGILPFRANCPGNGILYSVQITVLFYLLFPIILKVKERYGYLRVLCIGLILHGIYVCLRLAHVHGGDIVFYFSYYFVFWCMGAASADLSVKSSGPMRTVDYVFPIALWATYVVVSHVFGSVLSGVELMASRFITSFLFALTLTTMLVSSMKRGLKSGGNNGLLSRGVLRISEMSYSVFVVQTPIITMTMFMGALFNYNVYLRLFVPVLGVIIASFLSYEFVEKPSRDKARSFTVAAV